MNRIKIQVILLILQLETDYFSSYSFQKCSIRSSGTTVFTETSELQFYMKKSYRILQLQFYKGTHTIPIQPQYTCRIHRSREFSIQNPILHAEDKELFEYYYYYIQRAKRPSFQRRNSTHRRQGDLLEMHPCVLQNLPRTFQSFPDIPDIPVFPVFPDIPVIPDIPETFWTFQSFMTFQPLQAILQVPVSPGNPPHYSILRLECIFYIFYKFYSLIGFHRKLHRVPVDNTNYKHYILQRKGDVVISVNFVSVKMSR